MELNARTVGSTGQVGPDHVPAPTYPRDRLGVGIVHFGVGGFHRAHQAAYVDTLAGLGRADGWGICGVGVLPSDARMRDALVPQDGLYTLVLRHPDGRWEPRIVGSIVDYRYAPDDPESVIELLAAPTTRIVSLTITEGGYNIGTDTGEFVADDPAIRHDLDSGEPPVTVFGLVLDALARRRDRGIAAPTIMSCDNIEGNGTVARHAFTTFARLREERTGETGLADWVDSSVRFPNSMVDRITPVTTPEITAEVARRFDLDDRWPVAAEPFTAWVLEDDFSDGRPPFEDAGVQVVDDVTPYELMKLRLLNAGHQGLCYFAYLAGYRLVDDAARDPLLRRFLLGYMENEGSPTLPPVPEVDLDAYRRTLLDRFANPEVGDTIARLCAESSDRIPQWVLPVIRENLAAGRDIRLATAIVASWARYAEGVDEDGAPIEVVDRLADTLVPLARSQRDDPTAFIRNRAVFGDLADDPRFVETYTEVLRSLHENGSRATLGALVGTGAA